MKINYAINECIVKCEGFKFIRIEDRIIIPNSEKYTVSEISLSTGESRIVFCDNTEKLSAKICFGRCLRVDNLMVIAPACSSYIIIIDIYNYDVKKIKLNYEITKQDEILDTRKCWELFSNNGFVYIMGSQIPCLIEIDLKNMEIKNIDQVLEITKRSKSFPEGVYSSYFNEGIAEFEDEFILPMGYAMGLMRFDKKNKYISKIKPDWKVNIPLSISQRNEEIWATDNVLSSGVISMWNRKTNYIKDLQFDCTGGWHAPKFYGNYAYFFPIYNDARLYRVDLKTYEAEVYERLDILFIKNGIRVSNVQCIQQEGNKVIFIRRPDYTWFFYDFETDELNSKVYCLKDNKTIKFIEKRYHDEIFYAHIKNNALFWENQITLNGFIKRIQVQN